MLIDCIECGKEISHTAISCLNCGWRLPRDYQDMDDSEMEEKIRWDGLSLTDMMEENRMNREKEKKEEKEYKEEMEKEQEKRILETEERWKKNVESFKNLIKWWWGTEDFFLKLLLLVAIGAFISWIS